MFRALHILMEIWRNLSQTHEEIHFPQGAPQMVYHPQNHSNRNNFDPLVSLSYMKAQMSSRHFVWSRVLAPNNLRQNIPKMRKHTGKKLT